MQKTKTFHNLVFGISVLPALLVMPSMAATNEYNTDTDMSEIYSDGVVTDRTSVTGGTTTFNTDKVDVKTSGDNEHAFRVSGDAILNVGTGENTTDITLDSEKAYSLVGVDSAQINIGSETTEKVSLTSKMGSGFWNDSKAIVKGKEISVNGDTYGIQTQGNAKAELDGDTIAINADAKQALLVLENSQLDIKGKNINIASQTDELLSTVHVAGNGKGEPKLAINADNISIIGKNSAIAAMSKGQIDINGNTSIKGDKKAITTRGDSIININVDGTHTTKIDGDIDFDYDAESSGTGVDSQVNINLTGEDSYWNGNTINQYSLPKPSDDKLAVTGMTLSVKDGATWNATKVEDTDGKAYVALNNLNVDGGVVNIKDTDRGITVDNATVANATFNGGSVTINDKMTVADGTSVFNSDILGADAALVINDGATLNIGDSIIDVDSINLNGKMIANLTDRGEKAIVTAEQFEGDGKMSLIAKNGGNYKVFGNAIFGGDKKIETESAVYNLEWNKDGTVNLDLKSVEDIADDNNLSAAASQTVTNLIASSSDKLNDFGLLAQESLSNGDANAVEKAHKAINPEKTSAIQSITGQIQGSIAKLAANRMDEGKGNVWANGLFNKSKLNGDFNGYTRGVAAGIDGALSNTVTLGAGYAFNHSDLDLNSRDTEIDSNTVFAYAQYKPSEWYINGTLNYTMSDYTEKGSALGVAIDSDYKVNSFGGQVMTGYDFENGFTPEAGVRYMHIAGDTYTNSLGIKSKIDSADYLTAILGGKYAKSFAISDDLALKPEVRAGVSYDLTSDEAVTTVSMPGIAKYSVNGDRLSRFGGEAGLGVTMSYKDVDLSLTYDIEVRKDYTSQTGMLKAKYNF